MEFLNWLFESLYNWSIFGVTPFRFLATMINSQSFFLLLLIIIGIAYIIRKSGNTLLVLIQVVYHCTVGLAIKLIKVITRRLLDIYMFVKIKQECNNKGLLWQEFWMDRKLTVKGIISVDVTGAQPLVIEHNTVILNCVKAYLNITRGIKNIFLFIKGVFGRA